MDGAWCYDAGSASECDSNYPINSNALCSQTSFCKLGCCYDEEEGICSKNSPERLCGESNGSFFSGYADCNIQECTRGCCIIRDGANYVTEQQCKKNAGYDGLDYSTEVEFMPVSTELECLAMAEMKRLCFYRERAGG